MNTKKKKKFKIQGILMTTEQWFNLLKEPYKSKALAELKGSHKLYIPSDSICNAINRINWTSCKEGKNFWVTVHEDLSMNKQEPYIDFETITQLVN